jgi:manganese oxidase
VRLRATPLLGAAIVIACGVAAAMAADGPPEPEMLPPVSRYSATQSYLRGGEAERRALEAEQARIPDAANDAVELGPREADGNPAWVHFRLEVIEVQEEVYPGEFVTFWVYAPVGRAAGSPARAPSPTLRVQQGERVRITLYNTHYLPHTIHLHGLTQSHDMDGVPDMPRPEIMPGESFTYEFTARFPGTYFYHCHVHEHVHVPMGLAGMIIVEPRRPNNHFARLIPGAGRIESLGKGTRESHQAEYSLVYMDVDDRLHRIPAAYRDPREIEKRMHRDYDTTQRKPNIFLLNGRAFPFTLRDSPIVVKPDETTKLRVLNAGGHTLLLHPHGHHPTLTDVDGYPVPAAARITRDTFDVGPGQRIDLALGSGDDGYHASGPGVWMMHDHSPNASSNKGIGPGGNHTAIVYENFMGKDGLPQGHAAHARYFQADYYRGTEPVFDPKLFASTPQSYETGWSREPPAGGAFDYVRREAPLGRLPRLDLIEAERHRVVAGACADRPRATRRIAIKAGRAYAREGEVFGFEPRQIQAGRCEDVEVVFENVDAIRHDLMIPGLSPMFAVNLVGPATVSARFVTPDADVTLPFHCHVPIHEKMGLLGELIVGKGGTPPRLAQASTSSATPKVVHGTGIIVATVPRMGRLIVNHEEIKGFMAAMEMSYPVAQPQLLDGINAGDKIEFVIDPAASRIVGITVIERAK